MAVIHVNMLGGLRIFEEGGSPGVQINAAGRARQIWTLIAYLIVHHDRGVSTQELTDMLWPEAESENPAGTLKNNISRARTALDKLGLSDARSLIQCRDGFYRWAPDRETLLDIEEFERLANAAMEEPDTELAAAKALDALSLYAGDFIPALAYGSWTASLSAWYHTFCVKMCRQTAARLQEGACWSSLEQLSRRAFELDPSVEEFSVCLMRALIESGAPQKAAEHFSYVKQLFMDHYGVSPSAGLELAQAEALRRLYGQSMSRDELRAFLQEQDPDGGAFYCDCNIFREIVQLYARGMKRSRTDSQVLLITLESTDSPEKQAVHMKRMEQTVSRALRSGDPYTKISAARMMALLPGASPENGRTAADRIAARFRSSFPRSGARFRYDLYDLASLKLT